MNNIKLKEEYIYTSICDIDFKMLVYFDEGREETLYSLRYENHDYGGGDFLFDFVKELDYEVVEKEIETFMLDYICSQVNCCIDGSDCNEWEVSTLEDGLKLENKKTKRSVIWKINNIEDDAEFIFNEMLKFLNLQEDK